MELNYFGYDIGPEKINEMGGYLLEEIQKASGIPKKYFGNDDEIQNDKMDERLLLIL